MALLSIKETAQQLNCKPETLRSRAFRAKLGLAGVKIGSHLKFDPEDVQALINRRKEKFPIGVTKDANNGR